jgi:hypothetical protein
MTRATRIGMIFTVLGLLVGCKDRAKASAHAASENVAALVAVSEKDVLELERGVPEGAKLLAPLVDQREPLEPNAVRQRLMKLHREVPDLNVAKATFFALTDEKGVAIRNDLEVDVMAGQNLAQIFPELGKALAGTNVMTTGAFPGAAGPQGADRDFIVASPVRRANGNVGGLLVSGWAYRRYAYRLQEQLKHDLGEALLKAKDTGKLPILYVALFDKTGIYAAQQTPQVNEKALEADKPFDATAGGPIERVLTITERDFGYAAARDPKLGDGVGIAVLRSDI